MIRAVSRYTLEINKTGSPYFERAICFVRPEYTQSDRIDLHRAAQQLISAFDAGINEQSSCSGLIESGGETEAADCSHVSTLRSRLLRVLPLVLSALGGAGITLLIMLL